MSRQAAGRNGRDGGADFCALAREWARRTRAEQGLPPHVIEPGTLQRVVILLGRDRGRLER